jgi:hypothetical protein
MLINHPKCRSARLVVIRALPCSGASTAWSRVHRSTIASIATIKILEANVAPIARSKVLQHSVGIAVTTVPGWSNGSIETAEAPERCNEWIAPMKASKWSSLGIAVVTVLRSGNEHIATMKVGSARIAVITVPKDNGEGIAITTAME